MKKIIYAAIVILLTSCGAEKTKTLQEKKKELDVYKTELHELEVKIKELEEELNSAEQEEEIVNVAVKQLAFEQFSHFIEVTGNVEADLDINISPEASGEIIAIKVKEGDRVKKGQVIAKLNTRVLQQEIERAKINYQLALTTFERQSKLWNQKIGSEIDYLTAKTNKESLETQLKSLKAQIDLAVLRSPIDGIVDIIHQKRGEIASPQIPFAKVLNIDRVKVYADLSEKYITQVDAQDSVTLIFPFLNKNIVAKVNQIGNTINESNRTFRIRVDLNNRQNSIKPNMVSTLRFCDYHNPSTIVLNSLLIKQDFNGDYVFVAQKNNNQWRAAKRYVEKGVSNNNLTEIKSGLSSDEFIITQGIDQVREKTLIQFED